MSNRKITTSEGNMSKSPKSWKTVEITQNCDYGWNEEKVTEFLLNWSVVKNYAWIKHHLDKTISGDYVSPHLHLLLRFNDSVPTSAIIARCAKIGLDVNCITENRLQKCISWSAALNYLTHRDVVDPLKHKYDVSEVVSNFNWLDDAEQAHKKKELTKDREKAKIICEQIYNGIITQYNIFNVLTPWELVLYKKEWEDAFSVYNKMLKTKGDRCMDVLFVSGASGVGKDTFADHWCKDNNLVYYRTSNNDVYPFDDYANQPVIIWSDARDNVFTPQQLFALLDPNWQSSQKARFRDIALNCKVMIITSIKPLDKWYSESMEKNDEQKTQLYRRIKTWFKLDDRYVRIYAYDPALNTYRDTELVLPNVYKYDDKQLDTKEKQIEYVKSLLGNTASALQNMADHVEDIANNYSKMFSDVQDIPDTEPTLNSYDSEYEGNEGVV